MVIVLLVGAGNPWNLTVSRDYISQWTRGIWFWPETHKTTSRGLRGGGPW